MIKCLFIAAMLMIAATVGAAEAQTRKRPLILASSGNQGDNFAHVTFDKFMKLVEEKAPGAFDIKYRPGMALGDEAETVRLTQSGSIQMATLLSNTMSSFAPSVGWMNLPYFFDDRESFHKAALAMWDETNQRVIKESGCRIILINEIGFRNLTTNSKHQVKNLEEARRLKIRVPASGQGLALYQALGLTPVTVNFAETFTALAQGMADGQESAYSIVTLKNFQEVQKYAMDIETGIHAGLIIVSEKWLQSLPPELQKAIIEAGREASLFEFNEVAPEFMKRDREIMAKAGMIFMGPPEDMDKWRTLGRSSWPTAHKIIGNGDEAAGRSLAEQVQATMQ